jgi:hypothetical protein
MAEGRNDGRTGSQDEAQETEAIAPEADGRSDGGPGSHTEDETGGASNDPASGGTPEGAEDEA